MFQIAFHLPYYAWREKRCEDQRRYGTGDILRRCEDVSFLDWKNPDRSGYLHEAQISCVVAGRDIWRWVAYCFVDTYFDPVGEGKESALQYHKDSLGDQCVLMDPLTYGVNRADDPIQDPKEYFLTVFRIRLAQVKREWQQVVEKVKQSIREYEQVGSLCSHPGCGV